MTEAALRARGQPGRGIAPTSQPQLLPHVAPLQPPSPRDSAGRAAPRRRCAPRREPPAARSQPPPLSSPRSPLAAPHANRARHQEVSEAAASQPPAPGRGSSAGCPPLRPAGSSAALRTHTEAARHRQAPARDTPVFPRPGGNRGAHSLPAQLSHRGKKYGMYKIKKERESAWRWARFEESTST